MARGGGRRPHLRRRAVLCSNYISVELTDIVASLLSAGSIVALLQIWQPSEPLRGEDQAAGPSPRSRARRWPTPRTNARSSARRARAATRPRSVAAFAPYLIIILVFSIAQLEAIKAPLTDGTEFDWPGLNVQTPEGEAASSATFKLGWPNAAGTLLLVAGLGTMIVLRFSPARALRTSCARWTSCGGRS